MSDVRYPARRIFATFFDRVPIARGYWHAQELLDFAEVADRFHLPTIQTQNESVLDRNDLQQPVVVGRLRGRGGS
jgi:hypothetical protein